MKEFTTEGACRQDENYMVDISSRLIDIKKLVDKKKYFTINRARQYGKTTTIIALSEYLKDDYNILSLSFQGITPENFQTETLFVSNFCRNIQENEDSFFIPENIAKRIDEYVNNPEVGYRMDALFQTFGQWVKQSPKPIVLIVDEFDRASNYRIFLTFLDLLRTQYLSRRANPSYPAFHSVILAGLTDITEMERKIKDDENADPVSPWNIAVDFDIDMSLPVDGITKMLREYEADHQTGMNIAAISQEIYDYTSGYPVLVSRICQLLDQKLKNNPRFETLTQAWTSAGISEAARIIIKTKSALFDSLIGAVRKRNLLREKLREILLSGDTLTFNPDDLAIADAAMYGFVKIDEDGNVSVANRIFETRLYSFFILTEENTKKPIYLAAKDNRSIYITNGRLNMEKVLNGYVKHYGELYTETTIAIPEEEGRSRFILFVLGIINGTGNYYIEVQTRDKKRMDLVVDYLGEKFVVEFKIWRGKVYNEKGEKQLTKYLDYFHLDTGYMLSYNFNKTKKVGVEHVKVGEKTLIEAIV